MNVALVDNDNPIDKFTLIVSNLARLVGIVIAVSEVFGHTEIRGSAMAIAALFFAGAQGLEAFLQGGKK